MQAAQPTRQLLQMSAAPSNCSSQGATKRAVLLLQGACRRAPACRSDSAPTAAASALHAGGSWAGRCASGQPGTLANEIEECTSSSICPQPPPTQRRRAGQWRPLAGAPYKQWQRRAGVDGSAC